MGYALMNNQTLDSAAIAALLREEIARRRISRQGLAEIARVSLSTLEKALSGSRPFTLATVVRLEQALNASLRDRAVPRPADPQLAPDHMGSYARPGVAWIEGEYLTLRASFGEPEAIYSYRTCIAWDSTAGHLTFSESERLDDEFAQTGYVSMPNLSGHTYLVTSESGQYRLIVLGRATREKRMFGLLSTLQVGAGSQLVPVACPIALAPLRQFAEPVFGLTRPGEPAYPEYRAIFETALRGDFCRLRS